MKSGLYIDHKVHLYSMLAEDLDFAQAYLEEGMRVFFDGEPNLARAIVRDLTTSTLGFEKLSAGTGRPVSSLKRMLTPSGNPGMDTFSTIVAILRRHIDSQIKSRKRRKAV